MREESSPDTIAAAVARARQVLPAFAELPDSVRSDFLCNLALALERQRESFVDVADEETSLGRSRLSAEIDRTGFQLRTFASHVAGGAHRATVVDEAIAGPPPVGRPLLVRTRVPIGPVAIFAASNFPFAFSVLGGDTAAALAAGNPSSSSHILGIRSCRVVCSTRHAMSSERADCLKACSHWWRARLPLLVRHSWRSQT